MKGYAYVFLRKDGAGGMGHVGWGFAVPNGPNDLDAVAGATENYSGDMAVGKGGDTGFWWMKFRQEKEMLREMQKRNYDAVKLVRVPRCDYNAAVAIARKTSQGGYGVLGNNCLDHTYAILEAYGVKGMPWKQTHPAPNDWFSAFIGEMKNL